MKFSISFIALAFFVASAMGQEICPEGADDWPHQDCEWFYICTRPGQGTEFQCPGGTYWNPVTHMCDHPDNVPECVDGTRPPIGTTTPTTTGEPETTTARPDTTTEGPVTTEEPTATTGQPDTTTEAPATTEDPATTTGRPDTTTEEPLTTTEEPTTTTRPDTTTEEPLTTTMEPVTSTVDVTTTGRPDTTPEETPETEQPITTTTEGTTDDETPETEPTEPVDSTTKRPPGVCPPTGIHKIAHEERCESYYLCIQGERQEPHFSCPEGLYFDERIEECNIASEVPCEGLVTPTTEDPSPSECPSEGVHYIPFPGNCTLYYVCVDGFPNIYRCPQGTLFDTEKLSCVHEDEAVCTVRQVLDVFSVNLKTVGVEEAVKPEIEIVLPSVQSPPTMEKFRNVFSRIFRL